MKKFIVIAAGVAFEHLDMMLVSLLASSLVDEYVGTGGPAFKLLYAFMGYAVAFLFRPVGALCFGCIGDRYGRKRALIGSMILMSSATLALAFLPGVDVLGTTATLLFCLCRIAQGLAVGGEYGTAMTYAFEYNPNFRTFYGACVVSSTHIGGLLASFLVSQYVESFHMAFLIAGTAGFLLLLFRSLMKDHHVPTSQNMVLIAMTAVKNKRAILQAFLVASMLVLVFYGSLIYLNELVHQDLGIPRAQLFKANSILLALWVVLPPGFAYVADMLGVPYRKIMRFGARGVFMSAPLLGIALMLSSWSAIFAAQIILHIFHMLFCLCTPRFFGELFTGVARNTALSTSYSLGASFTAALAPLLCHASIVLFQTRFAICIPFMLIALAVIFILNKEDVCDTMMLSNSTI